MAKKGRSSSRSSSDLPSTDSDTDNKTQGSSSVEKHITEFLEDRFVDKFEVRKELLPKHIDFDPDEEEVFFLQVPKSFDVQQLVGKKLNLEKRTKIDGTDKDFEIIRKSNQKPLPRHVISTQKSSGSCSFTPFEPVAELVLREAVKDSNEDSQKLQDFLDAFDEEQNGVVEFPKNLKVRHPLLGADYEKELESRQGSLQIVAQTIKREKSSPAKKPKKRKASESTEAAPKEGKRRKKTLDASADLQWLANI